MTPAQILLLRALHLNDQADAAVETSVRMRSVGAMHSLRHLAVASSQYSEASVYIGHAFDAGLNTPLSAIRKTNP